MLMGWKMLPELSNIDLANEMHRLTKRYGELSLWAAESELRIYQMIADDEQVQAQIAREIQNKQEAELEKWIVLSDLKKVELEMDKRVKGNG